MVFFRVAASLALFASVAVACSSSSYEGAPDADGSTRSPLPSLDAAVPFTRDATVDAGEDAGDSALMDGAVDASPGSFVDATIPVPYVWPAFGPIFDAGVSFTHEGCNTVSYATVPEFGTWMIGRAVNNDPFNGTCVLDAGDGGDAALSTYNSLTWVQMDYDARAVLPPNPTQHRVLDTSNGVGTPDGIIVSAYDPSMIAFADGYGDMASTYWVAFECGVEVVNGRGPGAASTCMGPLIWDDAGGNPVIDTQRTSVVVYGSCIGNTCTSASVPKLFVQNGKLFLVWDRGLVDDHNPLRPQNDYAYAVPDSGTGLFYGTDNWATEVAVSLADDDDDAGDAGRMRVGRMYARESSGPLGAVDDSGATLFMSDVDMFGLISLGNDLIAVGGLKSPGVGRDPDAASPASYATIESTCALPLNNVQNCYRLFFAQSQNGLATDAFTLIPSEQGGIAGMAMRAPSASTATIARSQFPDISQGQSISVDASVTFTLALATNGELVLSSGGTDLWTSPAVDCDAGCVARFGVHGDLVVYSGNVQGDAGWQTNTGGNDTAQLFVSTQPPYMQVVTPSDAGQTRLWSSSANVGVGSDGIPNIPQSYYHFVYRPDTGQTILLGGLSQDLTAAAPHLSHVDSSNYYVWPDKLLTPVCDPITSPYPNYMPVGTTCEPSCTTLRGTKSTSPCDGGDAAGTAYDTPYCCL